MFVRDLFGDLGICGFVRFICSGICLGFRGFFVTISLGIFVAICLGSWGFGNFSSRFVWGFGDLFSRFVWRFGLWSFFFVICLGFGDLGFFFFRDLFGDLGFFAPFFRDLCGDLGSWGFAFFRDSSGDLGLGRFKGIRGFVFFRDLFGDFGIWGFVFFS